MAGLGRRTHYRKHLTDSVLHDLPEPAADERIAKVMSTRGSNQFDILVAGAESRTPKLAILPTKFHKLVWVKRNDYVIVRTAADAEEEPTAASAAEGGVRFMISYILYKDQVKHLQSKGLWPDDPDFELGAGAIIDDQGEPEEEDDGIVYNTGYDDDEENDDDLFVNTNRVGKLEIQDSSDEESSDGD
jgi:probable RNA-binding protein EIF1AD